MSIGALKAVVVVLGIFIAGGLVVLGFGIARKLHAPHAVTSNLARSSFGRKTFSLPQGTVQSIHPLGENRAFVVVHLAKGGYDMMVFSLAKGVHLGTIHLVP